MNHRIVVLTSLVAVYAGACGRLDLGDYVESPPSDSNGPPVIPPVPSSGGQASGGEPASGGGGGERLEPSPEGGVGGEASAGGETSSGGETSAPPRREKESCRSGPDICGLDQRSCCAVGYVSEGSVVRGGATETEPPTAPSHVSAFQLGIFEVTVGRFQAFLEDYDAWRETGAPRAGDGQHPLVPGSGWQPAWSRRAGDPPNAYGLGVDRAEVEREVTNCLGVPFSTAMWLQPVNCVSFYEAQAFCIWDGGRLPTDLEWEYAAAGGDENRRYPWGNEDPNHAHAMYGCSANVGSPCLIPPVGSYWAGAGRFGQLDLAGSLSEWTFDTIGDPLPTPCNDCASVHQRHEANPRNTRGGNWSSDEPDLAAASNHFMESRLHLPMFGIRCAYDVPRR